MHDMHRLQVQQPLKDILDKRTGLLQVFLLPEASILGHREEITPLAILIDSIAIIGCSEVFQTGDNIGMFKLLDNIEFLCEKLLYAHGLDGVHLHYFNGNLLLVPGIFAFKHFRKCAFP